MQDLTELVESARQDFAKAEQAAALEDAKSKLKRTENNG